VSSFSETAVNRIPTAGGLLASIYGHPVVLVLEPSLRDSERANYTIVAYVSIDGSTDRALKRDRLLSNRARLGSLEKSNWCLIPGVGHSLMKIPCQMTGLDQRRF
jgi:hypothetical protein